MRNFKTAKGTELPISSIKGKEYLEVKYRIIWFREEHIDWSIETELLSVTDVSAYAKATIKDEKGRTITTSHKIENVKGFPDFIEKAETGAIGRALALIGYGTQFCADDLDEGKRLADSPTDAKPQQGRQSPPQSHPRTNAIPQTLEGADVGEFVCRIGRKYAGQKLKDIGEIDLDKYVVWLKGSAEKQGAPLSGSAKEFCEHAEVYLKSREFDRKK